VLVPVGERERERPDSSAPVPDSSAPVPDSSEGALQSN
jgi:hypothetical protein